VSVKKLKLKPARHESREILTVNGGKVQSVPIFDTSIVSLDGKACEEIELTGSRLADFTTVTVRRPDMNQLKLKYSHTQDKRFYMTSGGEYQIHLILGDSMYSRIRTEKGRSAKPYPLANSINECMFTGPPLQPLLWDIMARARMSTNLLLGDIEKAFLQIGVKEEDRDAFRFLFDIKGEEQYLRFVRVPFGVEASPFVLEASITFSNKEQNLKTQSEH